VRAVARKAGGKNEAAAGPDGTGSLVADPESLQPEDGASCQWEHVFGGQAVMEGVMMRGRHSWGVAVRRPSGGIARVSYPLTSVGDRHRWLKLPVVRGVVALYESLSLGIRALGIAANVGLEEAAKSQEAGKGEGAASVDQAAPLRQAAAEDVTKARDAAPPAVTAADAPAQPPAFGWKELTGTVVVALAFAVGLFIVVPLVIVKVFEETFANRFVFNLVEGAIRIAVFLLYILGISLIPDLRRVFQYHGAEHKVIHAYEACGRPDAERAGGYSTRHPRCGTGFLLVVMVIAIFVFAIVGKPSLLWLVVSRIVGIPVIIGISYEVGIKWLGKHPNGMLARILLWPGLQLQRLTTREPTSDQLEVAAAALDEVIRMDEAAQTKLKEAAAQA
jgi:uncharacterized protein YqhQ